MTNKELAAKLIDVAKNYKTLYVHGCFGAPMTDKNKKRYTQNTDYNRQPARTAKINAASSDTFGFDCVCLIKGILWGWNGDKSKVYGGATYKSNDVPDIGADSMIKVCKEVSTDFSKIEVGEAIWMEGHIGVYVGDGLAVECTPKWEDKVQITACNRAVSGYNRRNWTKHGKLPYVTYEASTQPNPSPSVEQSKETYSAPTATSAVTLPTLKKGVECAAVKVVQTLVGTTVDGQFGPKTEQAVKDYQTKKSLTVDGVVGTQTWTALITGNVTKTTDASSDSFLVKVGISNLNIRTGPGTDYARTGKYTGVGIFTIVEVRSGKGSTAGWGRLKSGAGWISLDYATKQ